jgi:hypothetical protein
MSRISSSHKARTFLTTCTNISTFALWDQTATVAEQNCSVWTGTAKGGDWVCEEKSVSELSEFCLLLLLLLFIFLEMLYGIL